MYETLAVKARLTVSLQLTLYETLAVTLDFGSELVSVKGYKRRKYRFFALTNIRLC